MGGEKLLFDPAEFASEFFHPASTVDQTLFTGVSRMGIAGDIAQDNEIVFAVDRFGFRGTSDRAGQETTSTGDINKGDVIKFRMSFGFHDI